MPGLTRKRFTRRTSGMMLAGAAAAVLAACGEPTVRVVGSPEEARGPAGPAGATGAVGAPGASGAAGAQGAMGRTTQVVQYWSNLSASHPESIARAANFKEFNDTVGQDLGILVDLSNAAGGMGGNAQGGSNKEKVKTLVAGGTPPDMYYTGYTDVSEYFVAGMTIDLDTELKAEKGWAEQRADIFPAMLVSSMWAGKLVGMPGYTNNIAMIYNKGLLEQANVPFPQQGWTWDDLKESAIKFVREGMIPYSLRWHYVFWTTYLGTTGSLPLNQDTWKMQVDTSESLEVTEFWLDLLKNKIILVNEEGTTGLGETYRQAKNDTVFEIQGPYRIPTLRKNNAPDFGVIHNPVHPVAKQVFANNGGHNMIVFKDAKPENRRAAALVAKWMNAPKAQTQMVIRATSIPVSKATMQSTELNDYLKTDPHLKGWVDVAPFGYRWPSLPSLSKITGPVHRILPEIMLQKIGPKSGLEQAQREAQVALDEDVALMQSS